jgi:CHASE3 domain sensor protein
MVGENIAATETGQEEPYMIPPMDGLVQAQQGNPMEQQAVDPLQAMQQDPVAALQQSARTPGAQAGMEIDPEILAALGNIQ